MTLARHTSGVSVKRQRVGKLQTVGISNDLWKVSCCSSMHESRLKRAYAILQCSCPQPLKSEQESSTIHPVIRDCRQLKESRHQRRRPPKQKSAHAEDTDGLTVFACSRLDARVERIPFSSMKSGKLFSRLPVRSQYKRPMRSRKQSEIRIEPKGRWL